MKNPANQHHGTVPEHHQAHDRQVCLTHPSQAELEKRCVHLCPDIAPNNLNIPISGNVSSRAKTAMAAVDDRHMWEWDPYETSQKRDFIYRPSSSTPVLPPTKTRAHRNSYALACPVGATVYNEDFCWKPAAKPDSIRTGSASGNRRNNPHPSQSFMVWRLPKGQKQSSVGGWSPWKSPPSEEEIRNALTAQYRSTYRTDYLGMPQGLQLIPPILTPLNHKRQVPHCTHTEMRHNYRQPRERSELRGNMSRYGCNALHGVAPRGIVPTVVHGHIHNQENSSQLTTYDRHFGGITTDVSAVLRSLQPQELQQFCRHLPNKDKEVVQTFLHRVPPTSQVKRGTKSPVLPPALYRSEWMSGWPGPL
ncbi:testis-expressed protein 26 isoform X1 [Oncorhynchus mykiss]|uniref:Testis-expressed protein 26 n=2 Tax=Oncorhynchus mykiss TaxID=8022 RepID=A0A8C7WKZ4_ONCMY|nr:testis-expressed protein 26 isoform X1 [Oncorhynchus mykiss]